MRITRVDQLAVDLAGQRGLGQTGADRRGDVLHGDGIFELALAAVGKSDVDHGEIFHPIKKAPLRLVLRTLIRSVNNAHS